MRKSGRIYSAYPFSWIINLSLFFLIGFPISAIAGSCPDQIASYWQLDETAVPPFADAVGGRDGWCSDSCPVPVAGRIGGGQEFTSSSNSGIEVPGSGFDWGAADSFSIEYWMKKDPETLAGDEAVVGRSDDASGLDWWSGLRGGGEAAFVLVAANGDGGDPVQFLQGTTNLADGKWHHIVAIRDGLLGENRLYVDGRPADSKPVTYSDGFHAAAGTPLIMGGSPGRGFSGTVDNVAIYHRALPEKEIRGHYYLVREYCACDVPVKIMPLGNSITTGYSSGVDDPNFQTAYRKDLWDLLGSEGYRIEFVGSQMAGQGHQATEGFDPDNEGHPGWPPGKMAERVYSWASTYQPDVVLIHAGTNELTSSPAEIERFLDEIDRYSEDITVVLSRIINRIPYSQTTTDFNDNVEAMARARIAGGDRIILVDLEDGAGLVYDYYPEGDMWNTLHPYAGGSGYTKLAAVWHAALTDFLPSCPIEPAPAITSVPVIAAHEGSSYSYKVKADGTPPPVFSLITAPVDMTIDPVSGLINWTPAAAGRFEVTVEAASSEGIDQQSFTVDVEGLCPAGLISYWKLDEAVAGTSADVFGINQGLCAHNCPAPIHDGMVLGGQEFQGTTGIHVLPNGSFDWGAGDSFAIEYWMKPRSGSGIQVVIGRADSASKLHWWAGVINGKAAFSLKSEDGLGVTLQGTTNLVDGGWHHVAVVRDASIGQNLLYVDGGLQTFAEATYATGFGSTTAGLNIGWLYQGDGDPHNFEGGIDEIALYNRALAAEEVDQHYSDGTALLNYCGNSAKLAPTIISDPVQEATLGTPYAYDVEASGWPAPVFTLVAAPAGMSIDSSTGLIQWIPEMGGSFEVMVEAANSEGIDRQSFTISVGSGGLLALYHFDQTESESGQLVYDFSGNGHDASCDPVAGECPVWTQEGKFGGAFSFDGINDGFTVPDGPEWDLGDFTIATWVNIQGYTGNEMHIWGHRGATTSSRALWLYINSAGNLVTFRRNNVDLVSSPFSLEPSRWYHLAVTYQAANGEIGLYIDGVLVSTATQASELYSTDNVVDIGLRTAKNDSAFFGMLDELAVWERALTADSVWDLYHRQDGTNLEMCLEGETRSCYSGPDGTEGVGLCQGGVQTCINGLWRLCEGEVVPQEEVADGMDNDCDGLVDNTSNACTVPGETKPCGTDVGECQSGTQTCVDGFWSDCEGGIGPQTEVCGDGVDQDCDGMDLLCANPVTNGLLALYHFDQTESESEEFVYDFSGNGHDASCELLAGGCPAWTPEGRFGGAYSYDGIDDRFTIPDDPAWDLEDFTIAGWVNLQGYTGSEMHIWGHRGATSSTRAIWLYVEPSGKLVFSRNNVNLVSSPFTPELNRWYHLAVTYNAATGEADLYLDGVLVSTGTQTGSLYATDNVVDLGFRTAKNDDPFFGVIDEVAVWNRSLPADTVWELYLQNHGIGLLNCTEGATRSCYSGPAGTEGVGVCQGGVQTCTGGQWGPCEGEEVPGEEVCADGLDNDCDGQTDLSATCCNVSGETKLCGTDVGECQSGTQTCVDGFWSVCEGEVGPQPEVCGDGIDQDCDGIDPLCANPVTDGLLALYHFDQNEGESEELVYDFSGNGHDASCELLAGGCPAWTPEGRFGGAYSYDGIDDRFIIPDDPAWDLEDFTIAGWVNLQGYTGSEMHIWGHRGASAPSRALWLYINMRNEVTFRRNNVDLVSSPFPLEAGRWYHLVVTYEAITGEIDLYIDGILTDADTQAGSLYGTDNVVDLGFRTAKNDNPLYGMIDEVAVWNRALSADNVWGLYQGNDIGDQYCASGETRPCYSGPVGTEGVGVCQAGVQTCFDGQWGLCEGEVIPGEEICPDGRDNDCDGQVDECITFYFPPAGEGLDMQAQSLPWEAGLDPAIIDALRGKASRWALWRHGYLVHVEGDFNANGAVQSLRKTVHALTVGAAIRQAKIPSYDEPISIWQTELSGKDASATWRDVMTQSAGFDYPGCGDPNDYDPGQMWTYSDLNVYHLCNSLAKVYGKIDYYDFYDEVIRTALFDTVGLQGWFTKPSSDGIRFSFDLEDMGRIGLLLITRGRWNGEEVVAPWFIEELETKQTYGMLVNYQGCNDGWLDLQPDLFPEAPYGYLTWVNTDGDYYPDADRAWAWGVGATGQFILWNHANGIVFAAFGATEGTGPFDSQVPSPPIFDGIPHVIEMNITGPNPLAEGGG